MWRIIFTSASKTTQPITLFPGYNKVFLSCICGNEWFFLDNVTSIPVVTQVKNRIFTMDTLPLCNRTQVQTSSNESKYRTSLLKVRHFRKKLESQKLIKLKLPHGTKTDEILADSNKHRRRFAPQMQQEAQRQTKELLVPPSHHPLWCGGRTIANSACASIIEVSMRTSRGSTCAKDSTRLR